MKFSSILACQFLKHALSILTMLTTASAAAAADAPAPTKANKSEENTASIQPAKTGTNVLIFRNNRSWNRKPDFEETLSELGHKFDVKSSAEIGGTALSKYSTVIIPGSQRKDDFYGQYMENADVFNQFVTNGGTLLLELNGAENSNLPLPRGVSMVRHGAKDNAIIAKNHPLVEPLNGQPIHATYASHGFLENVPSDALVIATEMEAGMPQLKKPTYIEYKHGNGRVIAACQCFHDQDGSGRGILMETAVTYVADRQWYSQKK